MSHLPERPPVSVVMPFRGTRAELRDACSNLERIDARCGDELILSVNDRISSVGPGFAGIGGIEIVESFEQRSSYYARNRGAERATNDWLLFIDADCAPAPELLDRYFSPPLKERCGLVAGGVDADPGQVSLIARYARARGHVDERWHVERKPLPAGVTGNLLVRRAAFESLGGFQEGIRSGGDVELCWRIQEAGWGFEHQPLARVDHHHPADLRSMLQQVSRHAAGRLWVNRRYAASYERPRLIRPLCRSAGGAVLRLAGGRTEEALFKAIDGAWHAADAWGYVLGDNRASSTAPPKSRRLGSGDILFMTDAAPARSETFIFNEWAGLERLGYEIRMEATARAARTDRLIARRNWIDYLEDEPPCEKLKSLAWLLARHPLRSARDLVDRRGWRDGERPFPLSALAPAARRLSCEGEKHIHVHFAGPASQHALRLSRLIGIPYSVALHGYDVYQRPRNLERKLRSARFAAAACDSMAEDLRALARGDEGRIVTVAMGVDPDFFRPSPGRKPSGRRVAAIGRLVEKKGFAHLIEAAALLHHRAGVESIRIVGDGPLREQLESQIHDLGLGRVVTIEEGWGGDAIRRVLVEIDVLAVPSVIADDGDRDSMPVVAKEALAMEVPVVASAEVGLPELIDAGCGRLVPPAAPSALAAAIEEILDLPEDVYRQMGRRGRKVVRERFTIDAEARTLASLVGWDAQSIGLR